MTEGVWNCLIDKKRTQAFIRAIRDAIRPGDVVVDAGTGSGVLAMASVRAGAAHVYAIESDPSNIRWLTEAFVKNGYSDKITLIDGDATRCSLPKRANVIVCEMIATGLIEELQIPAMRNLLLSATQNCRVVLKHMTNRIALASSQQRLHGFIFPVPRYEYPDEIELRSTLLSKSVPYCTVDFSNPPENDHVSWNRAIRVSKSGILNGLRIASESHFSNGKKLGATFAYAYPLVLPVEPIEVRASDTVRVNVSYKLCGGFQNLSYSACRETGSRRE